MNYLSDDEVILKGYVEIQNCLDDFRDVMKKTDAAREYCDKYHFSVNGISYADKVENCCNSLNKMIEKLNEFSELLISVVDPRLVQEYKSREFAKTMREKPTQKPQ